MKPCWNNGVLFALRCLLAGSAPVTQVFLRVHLFYAKVANVVGLVDFSRIDIECGQPLIAVTVRVNDFNVTQVEDVAFCLWRVSYDCNFSAHVNSPVGTRECESKKPDRLAVRAMACRHRNSRE